MVEEITEEYGYLSVEPNSRIVAGSWQVFSLVYKTSKRIQNNGALRLTIPHFFTPPQISNPRHSGYVRLHQDNDVEAIIEIDPRIGCSYYDNGHTGRYGKSIFVLFPKGIDPKQHLHIVYGDNSTGGSGVKVPMFACTSYFIAAVDPFGDNRAKPAGYYLLAEQTGCEIASRKASKLNIYIPSINKTKNCKAVIHATDANGNIDSSFKGALEICSSAPGIIMPKKAQIAESDCGVKEIEIENPLGVDFKILIQSNEVIGESNPCAKASQKYDIYWGEWHVHTYASDGLGTPEQALEYAKRDANLDFAGICDHVIFKDLEPWERTKEAAQKLRERNRFVTFLGLEFTLQPDICDLCVITPDMDWDIREIVEYEKRHEKYHAPYLTPEETYRLLEGKNIIINPHFHLGQGKLWQFEVPEQAKLVEIYSCWGNHEYIGGPLPSLGNGHRDNTIKAALDRGYRMGFTAGSDSHSGQPGKTNWLRTRTHYCGGLTAILARELTSESLWSALKAKQTYATTGARIFIDFRINGAIMGSEITVNKGSDIHLYIKAIGTAETIIPQIIKNGHIWRSLKMDPKYPWPAEPSEEEIVEEELVDENLNGSAWYYLRVQQIDGHIAWSSPIWVDVL
jgi:hypothetical protein